MAKKNIIVVGGGFAGISALKKLSTIRKINKNFKIILIDRKDNFEFLPVLPDIVGGRLNPENAGVNLRKLSLRLGFDFIKSEAKDVDFTGKKLFLNESVISYEYLVLCSGAETNFFNNREIENSCLKLDTVNDALEIKEAILKKTRESKTANIVVVGGGYTGVEIATNISYLLEKKASYKIYLLERSSDILGMVPDWIRQKVREELEFLGIEVIGSDSLKKYQDKTVFLESGKNIENAICIWAAGVKTGSFIDKIEIEKERTRIRVKENLKIESKDYEGVFVTGDAASFYDQKWKNNLRMAVMFAMGQGKTAAQNILQSILKKPLLRYRPVDLGYIVPMAYGKAFGLVLGKEVRGFLGYLIHYLACIYRSDSNNRIGIIRDLFFKKNNLKK